jgi:hypothetical protein
MSPLARIAAALVALIAWVGLGTQLQASLALLDGALPAALWAMLFYFTIIANLLVALGFTAIALGRPPAPFWLGGLVLAIVLVGVVYNTVLAGMIELSGGAALADFLNHTLTPILVPVWWLAFAKKGALRWRAPFAWALLPLAYFAYGLLRAGPEGKYPYPFMDVGKLGWGQVGINAIVMAVGFIVVGFVLVGVDRAMGRKRHN